MLIFVLRKLGSFYIIRSVVSLSGSRVKPGISAALRGLGDLFSFQIADGWRVRSLVEGGARL